MAFKWPPCDPCTAPSLNNLSPETCSVFLVALTLCEFCDPRIDLWLTATSKDLHKTALDLHVSCAKVTANRSLTAACHLVNFGFMYKSPQEWAKRLKFHTNLARQCCKSVQYRSLPAPINKHLAASLGLFPSLISLLLQISFDQTETASQQPVHKEPVNLARIMIWWRLIMICDRDVRLRCRPRTKSGFYSSRDGRWLTAATTGSSHQRQSCNY